MKLRGILDSKGRRETWEHNNRVPLSQPRLAGHNPTPHPDGSLACSRCGTGMRFSPAAFAAHATGGSPRDAQGNVYTLGPTDPWVAQQNAESAQRIPEGDHPALNDPKWREEMIDACYDQRRGPRIAQSVGASITDD
jgi:hypothetical protein